MKVNDHLRNVCAQQRAEIEQLRQERDTLGKAVEGMSRSVDSILAVLAQDFGEKREDGYTLHLSMADIKQALDNWDVHAEEKNGTIYVAVLEKDKERG